MGSEATQLRAMTWMAAVCLMGSEALTAALLLQNDWDLFDLSAHDRKKRFLWICYRSDFDSSFGQHADRANDIDVASLARELSQYLRQADRLSESAPSPMVGGL